MGQPAKTYSVEETTGSNKFPLLRYFFSTSSNDIAAFGLVKVKWGDAFNSYCLIGVQAQTGNKSYVIVEKCDFYDISSGQERLVLAGYCPMMDDYKAANLMRVYFEHMYEYSHNVARAYGTWKTDVGDVVSRAGKAGTGFRHALPAREQRKNTRHIIRNMSDIIQNMSGMFFLPPQGPCGRKQKARHRTLLLSLTGTGGHKMRAF